jgi:hypothetical protein
VAPEDLAKAILVQRALAEAGLPPEDISRALSEVLGKEAAAQAAAVAERIKAATSNGVDLSEEDMARVTALAKAVESGKVRGLKNVVAAVKAAAASGSLDAKTAAKILGEALDAGHLSAAAMAGAAAAMRAAATAGATPEALAKAVGLERALVDGGMPK